MAKFYGKKGKSMGKLPDQVIMKDYPKSPYGLKGGYGDTMEYIDSVASQNSAKLNKSMKKK